MKEIGQRRSAAPDGGTRCECCAEAPATEWHPDQDGDSYPYCAPCVKALLADPPDPAEVAEWTEVTPEQIIEAAAAIAGGGAMTYEVYIDVRHHPRHNDEDGKREETAFKLVDTGHPIQMVANCLRDFADELEAREGSPPNSALVEIVEAARGALEALDGAIAHNVNATAGDSAGWTQADYDEWDRCRARLEEALTHPVGRTP